MTRFNEAPPIFCHCEPVTDVTGVAIPLGEAEIHEILRLAVLAQDDTV